MGPDLTPQPYRHLPGWASNLMPLRYRGSGEGHFQAIVTLVSRLRRRPPDQVPYLIRCPICGGPHPRDQHQGNSAA
jgi:hypothetical protein